MYCDRSIRVFCQIVQSSFVMDFHKADEVLLILYHKFELLNRQIIKHISAVDCMGTTCFFIFVNHIWA